ncbi:uncharacterized protein BDZ99DRAFT_468223 [Mytilinidion resinicola]|uniref:Uncharacterized protein n=1 Tax=Mytilinidion resinicola TaxID=574789 RepID=A0A6A6Y342_9PEZI|nr:uncharacterized protein BDZ99DRAFT_468223 [Mytilinidion resinicola]KAF2803241.1 hypothetical protein BDZ99DRAFT_468223 [Mytilinidion resinicola]
MPVLPSTVSKPPPPIQTLATSSSESQASMAPTSPAEPSPASFMSRRSTQGSASSTISPVEATFFESIASKVKRGRSRSRSQQGVPRNRSKSPLPPDHLSSSSSARTSTSPPRPQQTRHFSTISQDSTRSSNDDSKRFDPTPTRRATASSDPWRGRHANSWLFNDFSVTDHAKDLFHLGKNSRS